MTTPSEENKGSLAALQVEVDRWIREVGQGYYGVLTNTALLMEEVGELARLLARHYGEQSFKEGEDASPEALAEEFADVLFVLLCLANQAGVDIEEAFRQKLAKKTARDRLRHAQRAQAKS